MTWLLLLPVVFALVVMLAFERARRRPVTPLDRRLSRVDRELSEAEADRRVSPLGRHGLGVPVEHTWVERERGER
jgi:hypothetical protein